MKEGYVSEELTLVWALLIATVVVTFLIQRYKITIVPPSVAAMLLGIVVGTVMRLAGLRRVLVFSPFAFFYGLLPPIVFAAGFTLKKRDFFRNFGTLSLFAVAGTLISTLVFGLGTYLLVLLHIVQRSHLGTQPFIECMLYGALISATDPVATLSVFAEADVPPLLYNLVFGESVLNDAVAIVLFRTLEEFYSRSLTWAAPLVMAWRFAFIGIGSLSCGVLVALPCAFALKRFTLGGGGGNGERGGGLAFNTTIYEIALVIVSAYMAYLVAEVAGLSGIVALFFTGICHAHYSYYSVSLDAQIALRRCTEFAAFLCETFIFVYLGLQVATLGEKTVDWGLLLSGVPLVLLARAANIFPLAAAANARRRLPLPFNLQVLLWAVGLRGAVAYGLAVNLPALNGEGADGIPAIESATLVIVITSTLAFGGATGPLLHRLNLHGVDDVELAAMGYQMMHEGTSPTSAMQHVQEIEDRGEGGNGLHARWRELDAAFLKPVFGGRDARDGSGAPRAYPLGSDSDEDSDGDGGGRGEVEGDRLAPVHQQQHRSGVAAAQDLEAGINGGSFMPPAPVPAASPGPHTRLAAWGSPAEDAGPEGGASFNSAATVTHAGQHEEAAEDGRRQAELHAPELGQAGAPLAGHAEHGGDPRRGLGRADLGAAVGHSGDLLRLDP